MNSTHWLKNLVAIPTISKDTNLPLIEQLEKEMHAYGLQTWRTYNPEKTKANLFGSIPNAQGSLQGGIVFSGHTDVVPVQGQPWSTDPFTVTTINERHYGRGTADMKGFIACCMAAIPKLVTLPLEQPIHFAFSYDEEVGCLGAPALLSVLKEKGLTPEGCIVGEPTMMQIVTGHKGIQVMRCKVHGKAAHSSLTPQGANAIYYANKLLSYLESYATQLKTTKQDSSYDIPFTTLSVNQINGGVAINTIPDLCEIVYEFRNLPSMNAEEVQQEIDLHIRNVWLPSIREEYPDIAIECEKIAQVPGLDGLKEAVFHQVLRTLFTDFKNRNIAFTTEAGLFQQSGIPTLICGPGDIAVAHAADEYVSAEQLELCDRFIEKIAQALCRSDFTLS